MLNTANLSHSRSPFTLVAYTEVHRADVRDLAEMVSLATYNGGAHSTLEDPEDAAPLCSMKASACTRQSTTFQRLN